MGKPASIINLAEHRMKKAELEHGFLRLANDYADHLSRFPMTSREYRVWWAVIRKTYGYGKKSDYISGSQLAALTGFTRQRATSIVSDMVARRILFRTGGQRSEIGVNTNLHEWKLSEPHGGFTEPDGGFTERTPRGVHTKDKKDTSISNEIEVVADSSNQRRRRTFPNCPHDEILVLWERVFPGKPQPAIWEGQPQKNLASRWREGFTRKHRRTGEVLYQDRAGGVEWWGRFFDYCKSCGVLSDSDWFTIHWLVRPNNFGKVMAGNYEGGRHG